MNILFIDADKKRAKLIRDKLNTEITVVSPVEAKWIFDDELKTEWDFVFMDGDMKVVESIVKYQPFVRNVIIHNRNSATAKEMEGALIDAEYRVSSIPFNIMVQNLEALV